MLCIPVKTLDIFYFCFIDVKIVDFYLCKVNWLSNILSSLWRLWFLLVFLCTFILFMPALFLFSTIYEKPKYVSYITRYWSKTTLYCSLIFPKIIWEEKLDNNTVLYFLSQPHINIRYPIYFFQL